MLERSIAEVAVEVTGAAEAQRWLLELDLDPCRRRDRPPVMHAAGPQGGPGRASATRQQAHGTSDSPTENGRALVEANLQLATRPTDLRATENEMIG